MGKPYRECPYCGDNLDAGEICDCRKEPDRRAVMERKPPTQVGLKISKGVKTCESVYMTRSGTI